MAESTASAADLEAAIEARFGERVPVDLPESARAGIAPVLLHRSVRRFDARPVADGLLDLLLACALSAPSKSDLQQADIVHVRDRALQARIAEGLPGSDWIATAPVLLVFCGNNRRIRQIGTMRGKPFANDHLDAFMNAAVDAAIVMATFIRAAEAAGLGCCPLSVLRHKAAAVSALLGLPDWVFPVAGLAVGHPAEPGMISPRLGRAVTVHRDRFHETALAERIDAYDRRRAAVQPAAAQRYVAQYGAAPFYGWSEDKARQYGRPERADFGAFIRSKGFRLE